MKIKYKKIIAREILICALVLAIGVATFLSTVLYNKIKENKLEKIIPELNTKNDLLDSLYDTNSLDEKVLILLWDLHAKNSGIKDFNVFKANMASEFTRESYFDDANKDLGFKDYNDFNHTIHSNSKLITSIENEISLLEQKKGNIKDSILDEKDMFNLTFFVTIIAAILLIFMRYVYYLFSWCISTIRSQETDSDGRTGL